MGALRFKTNPDGPFLDTNSEMPTPYWSSIRELQYAAERLEKDEAIEEEKKWLAVFCTMVGVHQPFLCCMKELLVLERFNRIKLFQHG